MAAGTQKSPFLKEGTYKVEDVQDLNFFDLLGEKAKTKGSSNKCYHIELHVPNSGSKHQIHTSYGPTGGSQIKEWRSYSSYEDAKKDYNSIINSKIKKGYVKVDVAQRAIGSDAAKQIVKPVVFKNADTTTPAACTLPLPTQNLISKLFGATSQWVATTLKCPLGQLTNAQIDEGRARLDAAKDILNSKKINKSKLQDLTNEFYALIPHNLGSGSRGQLTHLLLDDISKIAAKEQDLDTLLDAKSVGAVLNQNNAIDAQYKELQATLDWIDPQNDLFKFLEGYFEKSKIKNHGYGSAKVVNIWKLDRHNKEKEYFLINSEQIAQECGKHVFIQESQLKNYSKLWVPDKRPDLNTNEIDLYDRANNWLVWHGSRAQNIIGISKKGLLIRPAGAIHTGSMYGDGIYTSSISSKSLNYCDNGYWTGGNKSNKSSKFMFLLDASFGNMYTAPCSKYYKQAPKGYHSVFSKAGSATMNDEIIVYKTEKDTQIRIRYLLEIMD